MDILYIVIGAIGGLLLGGGLGSFLMKGSSKKAEAEAEKNAKLILSTAEKEAETLKKNKLLEAKEQYLQKKTEMESALNKRGQKTEERERKVKGLEQSFSSKLENYNRKEKELNKVRENLKKQLEVVEIKKNKLDKEMEQNKGRLENLASMSKEEAKEQLIESMKADAQNEALSYTKELMDEAKQNANKEAKKIVLKTIQRTAAENTIENTVSIFNLESDDQKGQIIGREGRNIRALEAATGCEIVVDDTPEAVIISGFDAVRREVCRLSLERLVKDGRIHPARIEEIVAKTKKQMEEHIKEIGERTVIELGISGLHRELVRMVGRMRFRSSYGQNLLQHSKETARLCATMAAEMGINTKLAKRAGLLHDIGKVPDEDTELSHAIYGMELCKKYGEKASVCNAVGAHHDEIEMDYIISPIIQACDAISGARPGARRETMDNYLKRIKELEQIALGYEGVEKVYAIQAGRELRVIVESEKVGDKKADEISFEISQKIMNEMVYPGQIKVTVIRETRAVNYAK